MTKRFLEDMVLAKRERLKTEENKKNPRSARLSDGKIKEEPPETFVKETREKMEVKEVGINHIKSRSRFMLWFVALISVAFCFFALSFLFGRAFVSVNPKMKDVVLNENLSAVKDSNANGLSFDLVVISGAENKNIQASGEKNVSTSATGAVVIYNAFNSSPQILNIDTRLEGSNGKIYKTQTKITVPGMDKKGTPGQIEVKIYGSSAGADYNSSPLDFKIAGFKGTPKYAKIYGRSKGEITGGFVGKAPDVSDADQVSALADLKTTLEAKLLQKATDQIPSGFILFKDAVFLNTNNANNEPNISSTNNNDNSLTLTLNGTLYGILFNEQKLIKKIAEDSIDKYDGSDVFISNIRDLTFSLTNQDSTSFDSVQNISFSLSGSAKIVWKLDENKFTADLLGKSKKDFNQVLSGYPNIDSATLTLNPFWMMSVPDKTKNIKVIVNYPK